jgi:hypothetical protein
LNNSPPASSRAACRASTKPPASRRAHRQCPAPQPSPKSGAAQIATTVGITDTFKALDVMVKAHRQAVEFGITQEET